MAQKRVAVEGDVQATPGTAPFTGAATGTWTAGAIVASAYPKLTVGGVATVWKAECTFSFNGNAPAPASTTITGTNKVTLTATAKKLQGGGNNVLVHDDQNSDQYGNKLQVAASGALRSA
jgi:hypothetical protein